MLWMLWSQNQWVLHRPQVSTQFDIEWAEITINTSKQIRCSSQLHPHKHSKTFTRPLPNSLKSDQNMPKQDTRRKQQILAPIGCPNWGWLPCPPYLQGCVSTVGFPLPELPRMDPLRWPCKKHPRTQDPRMAGWRLMNRQQPQRTHINQGVVY